MYQVKIEKLDHFGNGMSRINGKIVFIPKTLKGDLEDGFQEVGNGYAATYKGFKNLLRIDYIFHSPSMKAVEYETIDFDMSDHNPVLLTLDM